MTKGTHHLLLIWLIFTGLLVFALTISWQEGVIYTLFTSDKSNISYAIVLLFLIISIHSCKRVIEISTQLNDVKIVESIIKNNQEIKLNMQDDKIHVNGDMVLPDCVATNYIHDLLNRTQSQKEFDENNGINTELIEVYESKLKGPHEIGWFSADVMIKMGLLGTIIGFIFMLGSVANITDFDVTTIQKILTHMSNGMGTALYTTLAGLVCSILASAQYHVLDRSVDELIEVIKHLTQVYVMPRLRQHV